MFFIWLEVRRAPNPPLTGLFHIPTDETIGCVRMPSADDETWAEVERAYVGTDETIPRISERLGVPVSTIHRHAGLKGWPRRKGRAGQAPQAGGVVTVGSVEAARNDVARRLYRRMSQKLTKMEQDATSAAQAAVDDPDDRMLTTLIRQFEKLTGLDGLTGRERGSGKGRGSQPAARDKSGAREQQHSPPLDAERIRNEIAERLEKLHLDRQRKAGPE